MSDDAGGCRFSTAACAALFALIMMLQCKHSEGLLSGGGGVEWGGQTKWISVNCATKQHVKTQSELSPRRASFNISIIHLAVDTLLQRSRLVKVAS